METINYSGAVGALVAALNSGEGDPNTIRRISVTKAEMQEIMDSGAFRSTTAKYYGESDSPIMKEITTATDGTVLSFYLSGILVCLKSEAPQPPVMGLTYPALTVAANGTTTFRTDDGFMLVGTENPTDDFMYGSNANIELGIAIRKRGSSTDFAVGDNFEIELEGNESWGFALTVGSLHPDVKKVTDMYDVYLHLGTDPAATESLVTFRLEYRDNLVGWPFHNYAWFHETQAVIADGATDAEKRVTQSITQYANRVISPYLAPSVERTLAGVPLGDFVLKLEAVPKFGAERTPVSVETIAKITKSQNVPTVRTFMVGGSGPESSLYVQSGQVLLPTDLQFLVSDIAQGNGNYVVIGEQISTSTDKVDWTVLEGAPFTGQASVVVYANEKFYFGVNNDGIYSYDFYTNEWDIEYGEPAVFTHAVNISEVPMFGTNDGRVIVGPDWDLIQVSEYGGNTKISFADGKLYVVVQNGETMEVFSGSYLNALESEGQSTIDPSFFVEDTHYDAKNRMIVVSAKATADESPVFYVRDSSGEWTFIISALPDPAVSLADGMVVTKNAMYSTKDYTEFTKVYDFAMGFVATTLLYA